MSEVGLWKRRLSHDQNDGTQMWIDEAERAESD